MKTQAKQDTIEMVARTQDGVETSLTIGAHVSLQAMCETPEFPDLLRLTLSRSLSWQARNENTLIRVVQSPNLAPQFVAALLAWGAQAIFGEEQGLLGEYLLRTLLHDGPLSAIRVLVDVPGRVWGESHVARTPADEPIVAAIAVVDLGDDPSGEVHHVVRQARLALTGAWREHARLAESASLLLANTLSDDRIRQVAAAVEREVLPRDDFLGSADYRRSMAAVLTRRALGNCMKGANQV
jgi:CO/xanthine dehydrogenase FAD-binding subunit